VPRALTTKQRHARTPHTESACAIGACEHYREMVRLRRNLHDGLGPGLAGIMLRADILSHLLTDNRGAAEEMLRELRHEAAEFMSEFRRVLADQAPAELDDHRLDDALSALAGRMSRATGGTLTVTTDVDPAATEADGPQQVAAFWIAREALTNVVKHANAHTCEIRVRAADGLRLSVVDDGVGGIGGGRGVGLTSMHGRAAELGGWCEVADRADTGVAVTAYLPAPRPAVHS
jgi:signal transduction histidine kinase